MRINSRNEDVDSPVLALSKRLILGLNFFAYKNEQLEQFSPLEVF